MAEKVSTLILKVDLGCRSCYKKIRKILYKLQDKERIWTISYDDGSNSIAVVGPFDPHKLSCKIRCMGGKVIKGIEIIMRDGGGGGGKPPNMEGPPPMNSGKKKQKEKEPPPAEPEQQQQQQPVEKPPSPAQQAPPDSHISAGMPAMIEEEKPREGPAEVEYVPIEILPRAPAPVEKERPPRDQRPPPATPRPVWPTAEVITPTVEIPSWPSLPTPAAGPCGCSCCQPCYLGYYEGCRCCSCGRVYGYAVGVVPPAGCYGGGYRPAGCQVFSEDDPASACTIM